MAQIGSEKNPVVFRKATVSKPSRFRKGMNLSQYKDNYDKIFRKKKSQMIEYIYVDSDYWVSTYKYWNEE